MKSRKVAFGGVVSALSLVLMLLTGVLPFGTYALPCFAGILLVLIVIEFGVFHALGVYAAVGLLSFLIVTDKEAALYYVAVLGIYPVLKSLFEKIKIPVFSYILKLLYFNLAAVAAYFVSIYVLGISEESFELLGVNLPLVFLALGNVVFIIYDLCVTRLVAVYLHVWRDRLKIN